MNEQEEYLEHLILQGAVEVAGIHEETGEFLYGFTDRILTVDPEMYKRTGDFFQSVIKILWSKGFISLDITEENPLVSLTDKAFDPKEIAELTVEEETVLESIMFAMKRQKEV
jgi:hypothetical protein